MLSRGPGIVRSGVSSCNHLDNAGVRSVHIYSHDIFSCIRTHRLMFSHIILGMALIIILVRNEKASTPPGALGQGVGGFSLSNLISMPLSSLSCPYVQNLDKVGRDGIEEASD